VKKSLSKLGVPSAILEFLFGWVDAHEECAKIPEAKGSVSAIRSEAFFIPLYELYLRYGGIFRLNFGPKVSFFLFQHPFRLEFLRLLIGHVNYGFLINP
jgi:beta-ring hydroxylase